MNLHKYDMLNQEIQVTPDYGYITNSENITVPSDNYHHSAKQ